MLILVTFLDAAKRRQILNDDPCLFDKHSKIKSSHGVLSALSKLCFARKDLVQHLSHLGIVVSHTQNPLEEYDYYIHNLSTDLNDGVRLAKLVEILMKRPVLDKMRIPPHRRNQIYNVGQVLSVLHEANVPNIDDVTPAHVVDAHQPRILQLLWSLIVRFQIGGLDGEKIGEEIVSVERWIGERKGVNEYRGDVGWNGGCREDTLYENIKALLLRWCQTVCSFYDVPVDDFTESFSDGKVLCLLVSFYHPKLLPFKDILPTAKDMQSKLQWGVSMDDQLVKMALQNERYNLSLALHRMEELGGMPRLFSSKEFLLPPDENSMILCVSFLFSRLTETSREIVAAQKIQQWWHIVLNQRKRKAASLLLTHWRQRRLNYFRNQRLKYAASVRVLEAFYRGYESKFKELARHSAMKRKRIESVVRIQVSDILFLSFVMNTDDKTLTFIVVTEPSTNGFNVQVILQQTRSIQSREIIAVPIQNDPSQESSTSLQNAKC
jgi:abnormal spindle-like microcephaly-associated protein